MKVTTRAIMKSLKRTRQFDPRSRADRAKHLRACRAIRGGRESLRQMHTYHVRPCPACNRPYDSFVIGPPRVALTIRCACCCQ